MQIAASNLPYQGLFNLIKKCTYPTRIVDDEGVIRLQKQNGHVVSCKGKEWQDKLPAMVEYYTDYNDGAKALPNVYVIYGKRIIDLSGLESIGSVVSLAGVELSKAGDDDDMIILCSNRMD